MPPDAAAIPVPHASAESTSARRWTARIVTAIPVLFLIFDTTIHLLNIRPVVEAFTRLGYASNAGPGLGFLELVCLVAYLAPRTAVLGAILLTGWLGGAIASHLRVGDPLFTHILFPLYIALMLWGGLYLRDARLRSLVSVR